MGRLTESRCDKALVGPAKNPLGSDWPINPGALLSFASERSGELLARDSFRDPLRGVTDGGVWDTDTLE